MDVLVPLLCGFSMGFLFLLVGRYVCVRSLPPEQKHDAAMLRGKYREHRSLAAGVFGVGVGFGTCIGELIYRVLR